MGSYVRLMELQQDTAGLLARVEAGERLVVLRSGRSVAELRPIVEPLRGPRPFGLATGAFGVPDDFDSPLPNDVGPGGSD
jgi:antitoxin (DNA-binding transcriptional repressor) of toxin-antitoxin stability system